MKIANAVWRSLMGDKIITGRDDKGLYAEFDTITIPIGGTTARLLKGRTEIGTVDLTNKIEDGMVVTVTGIEGRLRIEVG